MTQSAEKPPASAPKGKMRKPFEGVENFITFKGNITHGLGHYFEVELDRADVQSDTDGMEFPWFSPDDLADVDLRPLVVRDHIVKGTYRAVRHLISKDDVD